MRKFALAALMLSALAVPVHAQITAFAHVVVIVQENRTPDSLFYALCSTQPCSTTDSAQYDIQTQNWLTKHGQKGNTVTPQPVLLTANYDLGHSHPGFVKMCDPAGKTCKMDGAGAINCNGGCPPNPQFVYVDNSSGTLNPYLDLATQYGWANLMFQTNQGPSFPSHQFLFGATSAPSQSDDQTGLFASENYQSKINGGCLAPAGTTVKLIDANGSENSSTYPCFEHETISDLLDQGSIGWKYYAINGTGLGEIWDAPLAISHICVAQSGNCTGSDWTQDVDLNPPDVLTDIGNCQLRGVSWVTPTAANSDHPRSNTGGGPSWVASIVNAIGESLCVDSNGQSYWNDTAVVVVWDDWGGFYDHEPPTILGSPQGGYQYGFRVPMLFVSAYTPVGYIDPNRSDFGSIARFIEGNFGFTEGTLGFADSRAAYDLSGFYNLQTSPRPFVPIVTPKGIDWFIHDRSPQLPPDDD